MDSVATRQRPLRSDAQLSRSALLTAARELVAERGPEALTVVAVAERAGLNRSTAYQHFRSREELLEAVTDQFTEEVRQLFLQPRDFGSRVEFFVEYFRDHPDIARTWMFQLLAGHGGVERGWEDYVSYLEQLAQGPSSQDDIDAEMLGVIGMTSALVWSLMARQRTKTDEQAREETQRFARELKRLFLYGALRPESWPELVTEFE
ncbi:MAG: TetR/AcrR family transcriptional regulator [bacterium]|nr:TetR/AcrR family transcriptional regulator [bacterium]MCP5068090.1 TetR/AcrR family transcriptional regulator [bacterium]